MIKLTEAAELKQMAESIRRDAGKISATAPKPEDRAAIVANAAAALYFNVLHLDSRRPGWPRRDRMLIGGKDKLIWYTAVAKAGFFPLAELESAAGHGRYRGVEWIESSGASALAAAVGCAWLGQIKQEAWRTYAGLSSHQFNRGISWEALSLAVTLNLARLTILICEEAGDEREEEIINQEKLESFGWQVLTINGRQVEQIIAGCEEASLIDRPVSILITV